MKYRLNKLEPKTTNHFNINDVVVDINNLDYQFNGKIELPNDDKVSIRKELIEERINSKIGLDYDKYYFMEFTIKENIIIDEVQYIDIDLEKDDSFVGKIIFDLEDNSKTNFVIRLSSTKEYESTASLIINIHGSSNSNINLTFINKLNNNSKSFIEFSGESLEDTCITNNIIDYGGSTRIYRYDGALEKNNSNININTLYIGYDNNLMDMNYYLKNIGPNSHSNIQVVGALDDKCRKSFRGTIDFVSGASNAIGEENEECILLSDDCISKSLPQMLCGEENVIGTHGVSSGKVSEEKLFYLMSRGYSRREAELLIVLGSFKNLLKNIPDETLEEDIFKYFEEKLI